MINVCSRALALTLISSGKRVIIFLVYLMTIQWIYIPISLYSNPKYIATDIIVRIADPVKRKKMNIIDELDDFINQTKESKEIKRA